MNLGPMGWGPSNVDERTRLNLEVSMLHRNQDDMPVAYKRRPAKEMPPSLEAKFKQIHEKHEIDYDAGSRDLRLLTELVYGEVYEWLAQLIGSCVGSGGQRVWTFSSLWQVVCDGEPEELLGSTRLGQNTVAPFAPFSYGDGRRYGGLRGGDGSFCSAQVKSYTNTGVIDCNLAQLHRIVGSREQDYPETQDTRLYRQFGDWKYLDDLKQYADFRVLEAVEVTSANQSLELLKAGKPHMICSNWGFAPTNQKAGRFTVYRRQGSWAHNMSIVGFIVINGRIYIIVLNSWGANAHEDGSFFIIPVELFDDWLKQASCIAIGDIDLPPSQPRIF